MIRQSAIVELIPGQQIVGTLMRAQAYSSSAIHHHGAQDTIVYAVSGHGSIVSDGGKQKDELDPGDWAIIPQGREHQEVNDAEEEVRCLFIYRLIAGHETDLCSRLSG